ncbi:hypothetical protein ASJ81_04535 [Methanosarcina spelaei]|uniref:Uncharacterized protein n=1 Tax=Methanosarcina spelaei TaxID=1036679 RepID=A0A2A2HU37_9EURY|nr:hypothetical protein ASJ81_04535 [Methanosarcina spelaei]
MCILISNQFYAILLAIQYKKIDASTNSEKEDKFLNQNSNLRTSNIFFAFKAFSLTLAKPQLSSHSQHLLYISTDFEVELDVDFMQIGQN